MPRLKPWPISEAKALLRWRKGSKDLGCVVGIRVSSTNSGQTLRLRSSRWCCECLRSGSRVLGGSGRGSVERIHPIHRDEAAMDGVSGS